MSRKKGYKSQLPKVIPPTPRAPSADTAGPAAPAPAPDADTEPDAAPPPPPAPTSAPTAVPAPRQRPAASGPPATAPTAPVAPAARPEPPSSAPPGAAARSARRLASGTVLLTLLVGVAATGIAAWWLLGRDEPAPAPRPNAATAGFPDPGASITVTRVQPDGSLEVTHRIRTEEPIDTLDLALPETGDTTKVEATDVEVVADGSPASGPQTLTFARASYIFDSATRISVTYRLEGAVERSTSAAGRGLVTSSSLIVSAAPPDDTRVVHSAEVFSLACASSGSGVLAPCGESDGEGQWRVHLTGADVGSRVVAAVTVPS